MNFYTPVEKIFGIGPIYQKKLKKLGVRTISDLFFHFPHRYEDFSNIIKISKIKLNENCCVKGKILEIKNSQTWKKGIDLTEAIIQDETGAIKIIWFNKPYLTKYIEQGNQVFLTGKTAIGKDGLYLSNPAIEKIGNTSNGLWSLSHSGRIVPIYQETERLSSRWIRFIIRPLLIKLKNKIPETLPEEIRKKYNFLDISQAFWQIHFPDNFKLAEQAKKRFSFEELFYISLFVLRERIKLNQKSAFPIHTNLETIQEFVKGLQFKLTDDQKKSAWQILKDMEKPRPMNRLLEGEVGSGKTVVAGIAALNAVKANYQAAFMSPTEILAKQHFQTVSRMLENFNINIGFLTGKEDKFISKKLKRQTIEISRKKLLEKIKKGEIDILIGTHALIQDTVKFKNLALVILDEQHRFGVEQRAKLVSKKIDEKIKIPHLLSMTATPIPRTLSLTIYGDLDLSLISQLPKGRKKIITKLVIPKERDQTYEFIRKEVKKGRQVFVICPRIEARETDTEISPDKKIKSLSWADVKTVKEEYEKLSKKIFPELKIGMLHGKLATKEKERIMKKFKDQKIDILVSTSVVEVGVDVPNASVIIIEGAERFGLAQLYQFHGRVGRSKYQSFCFLFTDSKTKKTLQRLRALISSEKGMDLAKKDLEIRGPGELFGTRQSGIPDLTMDALKDVSLVEKTRDEAKKILEKDHRLKNFPQIRGKLEKFQTKAHFE
ncbi:MAG: ATP-dependent DNA helicase RecG [Patescibacteria group bacterium]|nr:ATP-dependent DNA helicase RecG [Patescibacteria group bacterium]